MELTLSSSIQYVPRIGPTMAKRLEILGIRVVKDLLYYVPFRYNDYSLTSAIARVQPGEVVTIKGTVESIKNVYTKNGKKIQQATVGDASGKIDVVWFNQPFLLKTIATGQTIYLAGSVSWFGRQIVMTSPEYEIPSGQHLHTGRLVPVYSETSGVSSKWLRGRVAHVLEKCISQVIEHLPKSLMARYDLMDLQQALTAIHFPASSAEADRARRRLAFDELFLIGLRAVEQKRLWQLTKIAHPIRVSENDITTMLSTLPFDLTHDQKRTLKEILDDLQKPTPMNRLLEGDVGTGKTVVAAVAMYVVFQSGFRSVLMAPTEILALQHFKTLTQFLTPQGITVGLITGSRKDIGDKPFDILVGTHALLSKSMDLDTVGIMVIDEQQRFGVEQRALLMEKGGKKKIPHLLTMTATPIPRTVARTIYGNLDLSVLMSMPKGRHIVKTWVVPSEKRASAYVWIQKQIQQVHTQAFVVCPLIEESESLRAVKAVTAEFSRLKNDVFKGLRLGLLHGRLKAREKTDTLEKFRVGSLDILVTTPVVEVGIDIPNASVMLVEDADRFGLAQLHQLRGRVGRGSAKSYCLLFTELSDEKILRRLKALETTHNGPELAELDLTIRGPGEIFGTKQHGVPLLKIASLSDTALIAQTQEAVRVLSTSDPTLARFPALREELKKSTIEAIND